ncbi:hypothetical protein CBOM_07866 [Ceraceosorus bombacis]|uniref:Uncharacterized protein n=1 Tax=Ceraceosorus bombacis TaxID=401625 RepID=A0A0P1BPQ4_9BASI|nr:hypothetical protein CBOM_07866 [Ceraceosorus bombacis]
MRNDQMGTQPGFGSPSGHSFVSPRGGPDRSSTATRQAHVEHFAPERQSQSLGDSALFLAAEIVGRSDIHDGSDGTLQRQALPGSSRTHVPKRGLLRL